MRYRPVGIATFIAFVLWTTLVASALAEDRPSDEFRDAAQAYEQEAADAIERAVDEEGEAVARYLQLATTLHEMAGIKQRAASMADADRWERISWEKYQALERHHDAIVDELEGRHASKDKPQQTDEFLKAAREYREHAQIATAQARAMSGVERAIYQELAELLNQMAAIKDRAADTVRNGDNIDWSRYEALSDRRGKLENMLEAAR